MKFTNTMKVLAAGVALGFAASAQAASVGSNTTWGEVFLYAYDDAPVAGQNAVFYSRGLGLNALNFRPNSLGGDKTPEAGLSLPQAGDATLWGSFVQAAGASDIRWGIFARKGGIVTNAPGANGLPAVQFTGTQPVTNNGQVQTLGDAILGALNQINTFSACSSAGVTTIDSCVGSSNPMLSQIGSTAPSLFGNLGNALGYTLAFTDGTSDPSASATQEAYKNSQFSARWTIDAVSGAVTYSLAAAVVTPPPTTVIPVPAAAWLLLSGLAGLAGFARRKGAVA